MIKSIRIVLIAIVHFGLSVLIVPITMSLATTMSAAQSTPSHAIKVLVGATRILHFPIVSQSWYSRQWFPGRWINIPIFFNSLLWAGGSYALIYFYKKLKKKK